MNLPIVLIIAGFVVLISIVVIRSKEKDKNTR